MKRTLTVTGKSALFIFLMGVVSWITGNPFIFPSLGPTAYVLAFDRKISHSARVVIGGHGCGILGGLISYYLIVAPYDFQMIISPFASSAFYLSLGAVFAIAITAFLMLYFQVSHPPACATTLIISLGIMPHWFDGIIILIAVVILYYAYRIYSLQYAIPKGMN
jgi:hypothetical protein